jgi:hypothetical protein
MLALIMVQTKIGKPGQIRKKFDEGAVNKVGSFQGMTGVANTELA